MPKKQKIVATFTRYELWELVEEHGLVVEDRRKLDLLQAAARRLSKTVLRQSLEGFDRSRLKEICRELGLDDSGKIKADIVGRIIGGEGTGAEPDEDSVEDPDVSLVVGGSDAEGSREEAKEEVNNRSKPKRPRLFIGSTVEALRVAREIQAELHHEFDVTIWSQSLFTPGSVTWPRLVEMARSQFDFALLVFSADDAVESRGAVTPAIRDNVLLEYALFVGTLGLERTFFLFDRDRLPKIASDLAGVTALYYYGDRLDRNLRAAVGPACTDLRQVHERLGRHS